MLSENQWREAAAVLPFLADPAAAVTRAFVGQATSMRFPAAATIFAEGDRCSAFAILAQGQVRVFKIGETGREITLYRFARGESCILADFAASGLVQAARGSVTILDRPGLARRAELG